MQVSSVKTVLYVMLCHGRSCRCALKTVVHKCTEHEKGKCHSIHNTAQDGVVGVGGDSQQRLPKSDRHDVCRLSENRRRSGAWGCPRGLGDGGSRRTTMGHRHSREVWGRPTRNGSAAAVGPGAVCRAWGDMALKRGERY